MPPFSRRLVPPSRSDPTSSGSGERCCSRLSLAATSSGEPTDTMTPPTWSESTHASARSNAAVVVGGVGAGDPGHDRAARSCPAATARRAAWSTSTSRGPTAAADGMGGGLRPARHARPQAPSRITTEREVPGVHRSLVLLGLAVGRSAAAPHDARGAGAGARAGAARHRCSAERQPGLVRGRRIGLVTNQSGVDAHGVRRRRRDCARPACSGGRCSRPSMAFAARPIRAPLAAGGDRFGDRPPNLQSLRWSAPPPPTHAGRRSTSWWWTCRTRARATTPTRPRRIDVMRAAAAAQLPVVVLDRPDPIGGRGAGERARIQRTASAVARLAGRRCATG